MSQPELIMFNVETIYPTGDFQTAPTWKLKVGSRLLTGQSTYSYDNNTQSVTLELSFKIPMSGLLEQAVPVMESGVTSTESDGAKVPPSPRTGFFSNPMEYGDSLHEEGRV